MSNKSPEFLKSTSFLSVAKAATIFLLLSGCVTSQGGLSYSNTGIAPVQNPTGKLSVSLANVSDLRKSDSHHLGAVRGGLGQELKTLETTEPVKDVVAHAFSDALAARAISTAQGQSNVAMSITINRMDCSQYVRREAHADFEIALVNAKTGERIYSDHVVSNKVAGSVVAFDTGVFGSTDELRALAADAMKDAIDQALDKPGFQTALASQKAG